MKTTSIALAALVSVAACKEQPAPTRIPEQNLQLTGLRQLALEAPGGEATVDGRIERLQAYVKKDPRRVDAWILLGRAWVRKARQAADPGFYRNANACADVALELEPQNPLALGLEGMVLMNDHRFDEARALAKRVLAQNPDDLTALGTLSDAELELGHFEAAVKASQQMVDLKPNLPSYARASHLRWLQGDVDGALRIIRQAIDAGGDQNDTEPLAWVLVEAAKIFHHRGDYHGAIAGYDQALAVFADHPAALAWKARALLALGRADDAKRLAARAYAESALAETAWLWGDAASAAGDAASAARAYTKVVELGRQGDRRTLALFYATRNENVEDAVSLAEAELESRGDIYTWDAYAWALHRADRDEEAKAAIARATRLGTPDARLLYHHGAILMSLGEGALGRKKIEAALSLDPAFDPVEAKEARRLLRG